MAERIGAMAGLGAHAAGAEAVDPADVTLHRALDNALVAVRAPLSGRCSLVGVGRRGSESPGQSRSHRQRSPRPWAGRAATGRMEVRAASFFLGSHLACAPFLGAWPLLRPWACSDYMSSVFTSLGGRHPLSCGAAGGSSSPWEYAARPFSLAASARSRPSVSHHLRSCLPVR